MTTALPSKLCYKATDEEGDHRILGEVIWNQKWEQQESSTDGEDGGGSSRRNWMEKSGLWPMLHVEQQGISQVKSHQRQSYAPLAG